MKKLILCICLFVSSLSYGSPASSLKEYASEVPVQQIDQEVAEYLANEIAFTGEFKSHYTLAEFKETASGDVWYILDGYFVLPDQSILFLDFQYSPSRKVWRAIDNYFFVPAENRRFLLKAAQVCNPYDRHFIGVLSFTFKQPGHLDKMMSFLQTELGASPMLYTDGINHMIQDLTAARGAKPLFTLREDSLLQKISALDFVQSAMKIPSGRLPSDEQISKTYEGVSGDCKSPSLVGPGT